MSLSAIQGENFKKRVHISDVGLLGRIILQRGLKTGT